MLREEKRTTVSQPVNQVTIQSMRIAIPETNRGELGKHIGWTHSIHGSGNLWQSFVSPHDANFRMCSNLAFPLLFMCNVLLSSCVAVSLAAVRRQRGRLRRLFVLAQRLSGCFVAIVAHVCQNHANSYSIMNSSIQTRNSSVSSIGHGSANR